MTHPVTAPVKEPTVTEHAVPRRMHPGLRGDYTFENFVIGDNNTFAANAAIAIAKNPGTAYKPLSYLRRSRLGKNPPGPVHRQPLHIRTLITLKLCMLHQKPLPTSLSSL